MKNVSTNEELFPFLLNLLCVTSLICSMDVLTAQARWYLIITFDSIQCVHDVDFKLLSSGRQPRERLYAVCCVTSLVIAEDIWFFKSPLMHYVPGPAEGCI